MAVRVGPARGGRALLPDGSGTDEAPLAPLPGGIPGEGGGTRSPYPPGDEPGAAVDALARVADRRLAVTLVALVVVVAALLSVVIVRAVGTAPTLFGAPPVSGAGDSSSPGAPAGAAALAARTDPALVDIDVSYSYQGLAGAGTGMVVSADGDVLTNNHVIEGATAIKVRDVGNGRTYDATVAGYDRTEDVAVLHLVGASHLTVARLGNSTATVKGEGVVAVGNAEGTGGTPRYAAGSVGAVDRSITAEDEMNGATEQLSGLIETNAEIVPGDSGGALVSSAGRVIGMTTAGSDNFQFQGPSTQGYAIPIDQAKGAAHEVLAGKGSNTVHVGPTAFLGVEAQRPAAMIPGTQGPPGAEIVGVVSGGPATRAGLVPGDIITAVDGRVVDSPGTLTGLLVGEPPAAAIRIRYVDPTGATHTVPVQLESGPPQ